ncbi:MAG: RnfABCDGE type electron transport complex subunit B [Oscillospiraceae bacterium]|nr:RnfABCDGE type electron transport complex subunit B [Oscillospiraceae bacterium]
MNTVLFGVSVLGALGIVFGLILAVAAKVFAVETDERQEAIAAALPGANCGGCGFAGCSAYAAAIVLSSETPITSCAAGGKAAVNEIARIMGIEAEETVKKVALVKCSGTSGTAKRNFDYSGIYDCTAALRLGGGKGPNECPQSCLGMGSCVEACLYGAIEVKDGVASVNSEKCIGCTACVKMCPKKVIVMIPYSAKVTVACNSAQKGGILRKFCDIGCIGCKMCEKACETGAIEVVDNLAAIDFDKCTSCGKCAVKCPRHVIRSSGAATEIEAPTTAPDAETEPE